MIWRSHEQGRDRLNLYGQSPKWLTWVRFSAVFAPALGFLEEKY